MKYATAALLIVLSTVTASAADVSGEWLFSAQVLNDVTYARAMLKVEGERLAGTLNEIKLEGTFKGDEVALRRLVPMASVLANSKAGSKSTS